MSLAKAGNLVSCTSYKLTTNHPISKSQVFLLYYIVCNWTASIILKNKMNVKASSDKVELHFSLFETSIYKGFGQKKYFPAR